MRCIDLYFVGDVTEVLLDTLFGKTKSPLFPQPDNCVVILINASPPTMMMKIQFAQQVFLSNLIMSFISYGIIPIL